MAYSADTFTSLEQPTLAKWNKLWDNDAYFDSLIGSGTAWTSWTPTFTNLTIGNGVLSCKYQQLGKNVFCRFSLVFGTTTSMGSAPVFTLPVTRASNGGTASLNIIGNNTLYDLSALQAFYGSFLNTSTTTVGMVCWAAGAAALYSSPLNNANPYTWATGDEINGTFIYEAA